MPSRGEGFPNSRGHRRRPVGDSPSTWPPPESLPRRAVGTPNLCPRPGRGGPREGLRAGRPSPGRTHVMSPSAPARWPGPQQSEVGQEPRPRGRRTGAWLDRQREGRTGRGMGGQIMDGGTAGGQRTAAEGQGTEDRRQKGGQTWGTGGRTRRDGVESTGRRPQRPPLRALPRASM